MATINGMSALLASACFPKSALEELVFPPHSVILEEGKVADKLYYVRRGCLHKAKVSCRYRQETGAVLGQLNIN